MEIFTDKKVLVFDNLLFVDDVKTPSSFTMRPAKIVKSYTKQGRELVDVLFDHRPDKISRAHFANMIKEIGG